MDMHADGIDGNSMAVQALNDCARWSDGAAGRSGTRGHAGALGRWAVGAAMVVSLSPRWDIVAVPQPGRSGDVLQVTGGQLVLGAVGPLHGLHPNARRGYNAQHQHQ